MIRFVSLALAVFTSIAAAGGDTPKLLYRAQPDASAPLWVSVEVAFGVDGRLKPSLFPRTTDRLALGSGAGVEATADAMDRSFSFLSKEECSTVWGGTVGGSKPARDLSDLLEHSVAIYHGRITNITYGFFSGKPGALLKADVVAAPKPGGINTADGLLVFYNYARFQSGGEKYCAGFREPALGEEFIVFAYDPPADASGSVLDANNRIVFRTQGGYVEATPSWSHRMRLGGHTITSFNELRQATEQFCMRPLK